ncbi:MAG: M28 family peptidase [Gemmatimonadaceae bacterium]
MLRTIVTAAAVIVSIASCDRAPKAGDFDGESALRYAAAQVGFGPRVPGSPAAQRAGDWIVEQMRARADTVVVQTWIHVTQDGIELPMRNIIARYNPGARDRILYVTHWDSRPKSDQAENLADRQLPVPGANDGASGVGLFVALGDALKNAPPTFGVDFLFVDGEDWGEFDDKLLDVLIGSTYFSRNPPDSAYMPIFGVVWDMIGDNDLRLKKEGYSLQGAPEVVDRVWRIAAELGHGDVFVNEEMGGITDDHIPLLRAGMRVINVIDIDYPHHHRRSDTIDKISARSLSIVGEVAEALLR